MKTYTITKEQVQKGFDKWNKEYYENPKGFKSKTEKADSKMQTELLFEFMGLSE